MFFRRRLCWVPTWRSWLALLLMLILSAILSIRYAYDFLAVNDSRPGGTLVIEGWAPDYALEATLAEFRKNHYDQVIITGGPIEKGEPLCEYKNTAEFSMAILLRMGLATNLVHAVPAPGTQKDRTYLSIMTLKRWLLAHGGLPASINLMTCGAHARRSRLLYAQVFDASVKIGVIAIPAQEFEPASWWTTSSGVRQMLSELIAYGYVRFIFHPPRE